MSGQDVRDAVGRRRDPVIASEALARSREGYDGSRKAVAENGLKWVATLNPRTGSIDYSVAGWASHLENVDLQRDHPVDGWEPLNPGTIP
jgi:hypothetical protein